jgi:hypothetical protein
LTPKRLASSVSLGRRPLPANERLRISSDKVSAIWRHTATPLRRTGTFVSIGSFVICGSCCGVELAAGGSVVAPVSGSVEPYRSM